MNTNKAGHIVAPVIARIWRRTRGSVRWRIVHLLHAKFMIGVSGLIRNDEGQVLLLEHRLWPPWGRWGLPTGYARKGERFEDTVAREVREETGLAVEAADLVSLKSGYQLRAEVAYTGRLIGGVMRLDPMEVVTASWFDVEDLPADIQPGHRRLIEENTEWFSRGIARTTRH